MKLLNLGCGAVRPAAPWVNVDTIDAELQANVDNGYLEHLAALNDLRRETNYVEHDLRQIPWPFDDGSVNGVLASHFVEHLDAMEALRMLRECRRILRPGGVLRVSVPDAAVFRLNYAEDTKANSFRLYGEPIPQAEPKQTFMDYALFFEAHRMVLTEDALWCLLVNAGFPPDWVRRASSGTSFFDGPVGNMLAEQDNRGRFSLFMEAHA